VSQEPLVLDACVVLNLAASRRLDDILAAGGWRPVVTAQAAAEAMWFDGESGERELIDYDNLSVNAELEIWSPIDDEVLTLITLAAELGDGEAASLAIAHGRGLPVATDDIAGRRAARALEPAVSLMSTSELLRTWSANSHVDDVAAALARIEQGASFRPPHNDPNAPWWSTARQGRRP
jgi:predicted nucleic acid-binding protein